MMKNIEVSTFFDNIAAILEIKGDNPFRIRAYRRAALNIRDLTEDIETVAKEGRLEDVPGIGKDLAAKITEIIETGRLKHYEKLKKSVPQGVVEVMAVPGVGPKTAMKLYKKLGVHNIGQLEKMAKAHRIKNLAHFKEESEENILKGIDLVKKRKERMPLGEALTLADEVISKLKKACGLEIKRISAAGSLRRMKETVRDIDILATSSDPKKVMAAFIGLAIFKEAISHGNTKSSAVTADGVQVDLRVVEPSDFGAALVYFTGSKAHNVRIRHMAKGKRLKINEYGVFTKEGGRKIAGRKESDVYATLKLPLIPPELREDRGEIEAGLKENLPKLITLDDIKGDLHVHTNWSDGSHSIKEMASAGKERGYDYIAITDHSKTLAIAGGLSEKEILKELDEARKVNSSIKGIRILLGSEVDILNDGSLGYPDEILKRLDIIVAAVHSGFKQTKGKLTGRILRAMDNPYVNIIAHPTGRLMGSRPPYDLDFAKIFKRAKEAKVAFEINSYTERLDLDDINARSAAAAGLKLAIGTDSHVMDQLGSMALGVAVARRAWLTKKDVINTSKLDELLKFLKK